MLFAICFLVKQEIVTSVRFVFLSRKKILESLSRTGVVMIDDPTISKIFTEFLLHVQGGLLAGSNKEGMTAPKALTTSNSEELPRYINYFVNNCVTASTDYKLFHVLALHELLPFMEENKVSIMLLLGIFNCKNF